MYIKRLHNYLLFNENSILINTFNAETVKHLRDITARPREKYNAAYKHTHTHTHTEIRIRWKKTWNKQKPERICSVGVVLFC